MKSLLRKRISLNDDEDVEKDELNTTEMIGPERKIKIPKRDIREIFKAAIKG